jgi:hypothetical protein
MLYIYQDNGNNIIGRTQEQKQVYGAQYIMYCTVIYSICTFTGAIFLGYMHCPKKRRVPGSITEDVP